MRKIDHHALRKTGFCQFLASRIDTGGVEIRCLAATQNNVAILVARRRENRRMPTLGHRQKVVRCGGCLDRVDRDTDVAVGAILETDRARQPRSQLPMRLRFRGARTNRAPGDQVGEVLWRDQVKVFSRCRKPK